MRLGWVWIIIATPISLIVGSGALYMALDHNPQQEYYVDGQRLTADTYILFLRGFLEALAVLSLPLVIYLIGAWIGRLVDRRWGSKL